VLPENASADLSSFLEVAMDKETLFYRKMGVPVRTVDGLRHEQGIERVDVGETAPQGFDAALREDGRWAAPSAVGKAGGR